MSIIRSFARDTSAVAFAEYLVLLALVLGGVLAAIVVVAGGISAAFNSWASFIVSLN